jgi:ketosteroid isomerase-like protein
MTGILGALEAVELAAIQTAGEEMVRSVRAADWDAFMRVYDAQTIVMPPNVAPLDEPAQLRSFAEAFPTISAFQITPAEIDGRADLAFERGRFEMTTGGSADGGSYLRIWRKQTDGSWKIFRDIWHSNPATVGRAEPPVEEPHPPGF